LSPRTSTAPEKIAMVNGSDSRPTQTSSSQIEQKAVGLDPVYTDLKNPDFGEVAKVMGIWGRSVSKADGLYTDRKPASPVLINGWVREGYPDTDTTRLATEIATAVTQITAMPAERVLVVIQSSPACYAAEGGRVLPEPGHEQTWIAGS
jgi:hypothetical protein